MANAVLSRNAVGALIAALVALGLTGGGCATAPVISPAAMAASASLRAVWAARCSSLGVLVRYADDFVAMCRTESQAREALASVDTVIVDEVHSVAGTKRGAHLALSLGPDRFLREIQIAEPRLALAER